MIYLSKNRTSETFEAVFREPIAFAEQVSLLCAPIYGQTDTEQPLVTLIGEISGQVTHRNRGRIIQPYSSALFTLESELFCPGIYDLIPLALFNDTQSGYPVGYVLDGVKERIEWI